MKKLFLEFLINNWEFISSAVLAAIIRFIEKNKMKKQVTEKLNEIYPEIKNDNLKRSKWWELFNLLNRKKK